MRTLKSRKLILFFVAILTALTFTLGFANLKFAKADVLVENYFKYDSGTVTAGDMIVDGSTAKIKVYADKTIESKYELAVNDFSVKVTVPANAKKFTVNFVTDSYCANGNKTADGFDKKVTNALTVNVGTDLVYNGKTNAVVIEKGESFVVTTKVVDSFLLASVTVDGVTTDLDAGFTTDYAYRVEDTDKTLAKLNFEAELEDGATDNYLVISSVNQKASAGDDYEENKYYQDFEVQAGGIKNHADPIIEINANIFAKQGDRYIAELGRKYEVSVSGTNLFGNFSEGSYTISTDSQSAVVENKTIVFTSVGDCMLTVKNVDQIAEQYKITVVDEAEDTNAPKYDLSAGYLQGIESLKSAINDLLYDEEGNTKVSIGSSQYLTLNKNMFKNLVTDDYTGFEGLTAKIYYKSETKSGDVANYKIPLREAGRYQFYVAFVDHNGNEMDSANFYFQDNGDPNNLIKGAYADYIFTFDIVDTSNLDIDAYKMGTGYVGAKYNAVPFNVDATFDYTDTYKLYYTSATDKNALADATWVEITKFSSATNEEKDYNGYTYEEVRAIAYDGKLSFVPDRVGFYKIEMSVSSSSSTKKGTESVIIEVVEPVKEVKVGKTWIEENVWSVVYLSVGTVCLIAILVLLFIKPKDEDDIDNI